MSASLARYLKDFSAPPAPPAILLEEDAGLAESDDFHFHEPPQPEIDLDEERRTAFEEGRAAMLAEMEEDHADRIAALQKAHADAQVALKAEYEQKIAGQIARRLEEIENAMAGQLSASLFNTLLPIINEQLAHKAVEALAASVRSAFHDPDGIEIVLRGPASLADPLSRLLADSGLALRHIETVDRDLTVEHGETVFVTRLAAWGESVEELLK